MNPRKERSQFSLSLNLIITMPIEGLKEIIDEAVNLYSRLSKSRSLKHVRRSNVLKLTHIIKHRPQIEAQISDIISKRSHYSAKLFKLLDSCIQKDSSLASTVGEDSEIDPRYITTRFHARRYLLFMDSTMLKRIQTTIDEHWDFQQRQKNIRDAIERNPNYNDKEAEEKLEKLAEELYEEQLGMGLANSKRLKEWKIPFFALEKEWEYPELDEDKKWILEALQLRVKNET